MFNNFVKSMMAICIVTSGWSTISSGRPRGLIQSKIDDFFSNGNKAAYSGDGKNSEIKDRTADENSDINTSNSSDVSIEEKERNENSLVQYGVINIILGSSDLKASNPSGGSIKKVDVETQTIEEVKSPSTTSDTMNESINTVDTLKIEGHSSGEEDGSGSDSFHYNKDADTPASSEERRRPMETQTENNENGLVQFDCVDIVEDCGSGEDSREMLIKSGDVETKIVEKDVERNNTEERCYIDLLTGESSVPSEKATIRPGSYCRRTDPVNSLISFVEKGNQVNYERLNNTLYDVSDADQSNKLLGLLKDQIDGTNIVSLLGGLLYVTRQFGSRAITDRVKEILSKKCAEYGVSITAECKEEVKACLKENPGLGESGEVDDDTVEYFAILSEIYTRTYPEQ